MKSKNSSFIYCIFILSYFTLITFFLTKNEYGLYIGGGLLLLLFIYLTLKIISNDNLTKIIYTPILLSIFQNVYLGYFCQNIDKQLIRFMTILNFIIVLYIFLLSLLKRRKIKLRKSEGNIFLVLCFYILVSFIIFNSSNFLSTVSSIRNTVSLFLYYFVIKLNIERIDIEELNNMILYTGLAVIVFGLYEIFINNNIWKQLNITNLWNKKGIHVQPSGLPTNFYSSETINGERIRRMASTFADPVNLGSFLFVLFLISSYKKKRIIQILSLLSILLTVSKGAFLGVLIYIIVYASQKLKREQTFIVALGSISIGIIFLIYAYIKSANSVFVHINGLFAAFLNIYKKPFGYGIGMNGVLASQFSGNYSNSAITESGLGMIISQLGIVGLACFVLFFKNLYDKSKTNKDTNIRILIITLLLSITANIFFNEVALSPNTCGLYFILISYYCNTNREVEDNERYNQINN